MIPKQNPSWSMLQMFGSPLREFKIKDRGHIYSCSEFFKVFWRKKIGRNRKSLNMSWQESSGASFVVVSARLQKALITVTLSDFALMKTNYLLCLSLSWSKFLVHVFDRQILWEVGKFEGTQGEALIQSLNPSIQNKMFSTISNFKLKFVKENSVLYLSERVLCKTQMFGRGRQISLQWRRGQDNAEGWLCN